MNRIETMAAAINAMEAAEKYHSKIRARAERKMTKVAGEEQLKLQRCADKASGMSEGLTQARELLVSECRKHWEVPPGKKAGVKRIAAGLCEGRHTMPVEHYIYPMTVDPFDFYRLQTAATYRLVELMQGARASDAVANKTAPAAAAGAGGLRRPKPPRTAGLRLL